MRAYVAQRQRDYKVCRRLCSSSPDVFGSPPACNAPPSVTQPSGMGAGTADWLRTLQERALLINFFDESQHSISPAQSTNICPLVTLRLYSEAYAASWGSQIISMEVGENILHTQSKASPKT